MFDWRWMIMKGLIRALHKAGMGDGKFVFAVAVRPEPGRGRLEIALADTTAIPEGQPVRDLADIVVKRHMEAAVRAFFANVAPADIPEGLMEALRADSNLPERSWKTDQVGEA